MILACFFPLKQQFGEIMKEALAQPTATMKKDTKQVDMIMPIRKDNNVANKVKMFKMLEEMKNGGGPEDSDVAKVSG